MEKGEVIPVKLSNLQLTCMLGGVGEGEEREAELKVREQRVKEAVDLMLELESKHEK